MAHLFLANFDFIMVHLKDSRRHINCLFLFGCLEPRTAVICTNKIGPKDDSMLHYSVFQKSRQVMKYEMEFDCDC